jgi:peptide subunit release factor 1 (eRF1)
MYTILIIDLEECYGAQVMSDGEIKKLIDIHSEVPHKHKKGGQSAARFSRIRDNEITHWFKRINEYMKELNAENIYLSISFVYKQRFLDTLSTYNLAKIGRIERNEYGGLTGVYQLVNMLEAEKGNTRIG